MMTETTQPSTMNRAPANADPPAATRPSVDARAAELQAALLARYDVQGRSRWLGSDGDRRVHLVEAGRGEPLVLLHGGGSLWAEWASLLAHLQHDFRCLAVDRPGHGLSYRVDYRKVPDFRDDAAAFVERTLDLLGLDKATLVGNSMGGFFSFCFALAHPERVERLVLVGAPAGIDRRIPVPLRLMGTPVVGPLMWKTVFRPSQRGLRELYRKLLVADASRVSNEEIACTVAAHEQPGADIAWLSLLRRFLTLRGIDERCYIGDALRGLSVPTRFVWGERDAFTSPDAGRELCGAMPDAQIEVVEGAGHLPWVDAPEQCADAIRRFLAVR